VVAGGVALIRARTEDPIVESVIALVTPYLAYVLAEVAHGSGVTAVVVAAVTLGALRHRLTSPPTRLQLAAVYPTVIFLLESVVFSLIGLQLPGLVRRLAAAHEAWLLAALAISATLVVVRVAWVWPIAALAARRQRSVHSKQSGDEEPPARQVWQVTAVVAWAGTRGVVPLAAALSVPLTDHTGAPLVGRDLILVLSIAVIAISLVAQGFTLSAVVGRSGLAVPSSRTQDEVRAARVHLDAAGLDYLDHIADLGAATPAGVERIRQRLRARVEMRQPEDGSEVALAYRRVWRDVVAVQSVELQRMYADHRLSESAFRRLQRQLDLEDARLADD
jgi:CPA1 family monovalent cation:H+ antiporter